MAVDAPPTAEFLIAHGADPAQAASLAAQAKGLSPANSFNDRVARTHELAGQPPAPKDAPPPPTTNAELADATTAHEDAQLAQVHASLWPKSASSIEFNFPEPEGGHTDESMAENLAAAEAFHSAGLAPGLWNPTIKMLDESLRSQAGSTPQQVLDRQLSGLERMWAGDFDKNMAVYQSIIEAWQQSPALRSYTRLAPYLNPISISQLVEAKKLGR